MRRQFRVLVAIPPMNPTLNRRTFLTQTALGAAALGTSAFVLAQAPVAAPPKPPEPARGAPLELPLVKEFVAAGHGNIPRVQELLARHPALIHASYDWGRGDFETALNGASHVGRRDAALCLIEAGARVDAPCAAMLGETEIVGALIRLAPQTANLRGAHGFSLLYHAAYSGKVPIAELLSPHLAERAHDCNQALQPASQAGHAELVAWLLRHGVTNPNTRNFQGRTPLDLALERKHDDVVALLRAAGGVSGRS